MKTISRRILRWAYSPIGPVDFIVFVALLVLLMGAISRGADTQPGGRPGGPSLPGTADGRNGPDGRKAETAAEIPSKEALRQTVEHMRELGRVQGVELAEAEARRVKLSAQLVSVIGQLDAATLALGEVQARADAQAASLARAVGKLAQTTEALQAARTENAKLKLSLWEWRAVVAMIVIALLAWATAPLWKRLIF